MSESVIVCGVSARDAVSTAATACVADAARRSSGSAGGAATNCLRWAVGCGLWAVGGSFLGGGFLGGGFLSGEFLSSGFLSGELVVKTVREAVGSEVRESAFND